MKKSQSSHEVDRALVEYERWHEIHGHDVQTFVKQKQFSPEVANVVIEMVRLEEQLRGMAEQHYPKTGFGFRPIPLEGKIQGNYRFIRRLGVGGMGAVWLAEQQKPVQREVAIKLIRAGMYSETMVRRFAVERQALAMMSHPHIAKVLDAGATQDGRPYFVMEYVPGVSIVEYCNENRLSLRERLLLFLQLCDAIQHAHQKSLLHRDVKPTNVLVTEVDGKPHVRVIDFGLAKVFSPEGKWDGHLTQVETPLGSPIWMSPEQAQGRKGETENVDTRTDIYSMGVILYQLLTNSTPITDDFFDSASHRELLDAILDTTPPYPSHRLMEDETSKEWIANATDANFLDWFSQLRNDLDWVTMKSLEKNPDRRYPTVAAFADDVVRFLDQEPVVARPPSMGYQLKKMFRKHQRSVLSVAGLAALLLVTSIVSMSLAIWAIEERQSAEVQRSRAKKSLGIVMRQFGNLNFSNPGVEYNSIKQEMLLSFSEELNKLGLEDDPATEANLRIALAQTLSGSGQHEDAVREFEQAILVLERMGDELKSIDVQLLVSAKTHLAIEFLRLKESDAARAPALESLDLALNEFGSGSEPALGAQLAVERVQLETVEPRIMIGKLERLQKQIENVLGRAHPHSVEALAALGDSYHKRQRYADASRIYNEARKLASELWGSDYRRTIELEVRYWEACSRDYRFLKSPEDLSRFVVRISKKFGPVNHVTLQLQDELGGILQQQGKSRQAYDLYNENLRAYKKQYGEKSLRTAKAFERLALASAELDDFENALTLIGRANSLYANNAGLKSLEAIRGNFYASQFYFKSGRYGKALEMVERFLPLAHTNLGTDSPISNDLVELKARCFVQLGQPQRALPIFVKIWNRLKDSDEVADPEKCRWLERLGTVNFLAGNSEGAIGYLDAAFMQTKLHSGMRSRVTQDICARLQNVLLEQRQFARAEELMRSCLSHLQPTMAPFEEYYIWNQVGLAEVLLSRGEFAHARGLCENVMSKAASSSKHRLSVARAKSLLAMCQVHVGDFELAERLLNEAKSEMECEELPQEFEWFEERLEERFEKLMQAWELVLPTRRVEQLSNENSPKEQKHARKFHPKSRWKGPKEINAVGY